MAVHFLASISTGTYLLFEGERHSYEHLRDRHTHTHTRNCDYRRQSLKVYNRLRLEKWRADELKRERKNLGYGARNPGLKPSSAIY